MKYCKVSFLRCYTCLFNDDKSCTSLTKIVKFLTVVIIIIVIIIIFIIFRIISYMIIGGGLSQSA
jgi:hypothetical protein